MDSECKYQLRGTLNTLKNFDHTVTSELSKGSGSLAKLSQKLQNQLKIDN